MGFLEWFVQNWFNFLQSIGIIAGLLFTGAAFKRDAKSRQVVNLIEITKQHREIWLELYARPELVRILDSKADFENAPITVEEELFVGLLILHLNAAYHAIKDGMAMKPDRLREDIQQFFSRPLAQAVWEKAKLFQDEDFVQWVTTVRDGAAQL
jgi:hypothetical protein